MSAQSENTIQEKYGSDADHIGVLVAEPCPECGHDSYRNMAGDVWCANPECIDNQQS
jgi:hypothetical protein